jgi:AGZA family xanthine/uracil permease-like MFS transporter
MKQLFERIFGLSQRGSNVRTEVLGGITTFVTMAYIIVVNPAILKEAGIPVGPGTVATILAAVFGCLLMGFYANRPIAVAPYMGENVFLAVVGLPILLAAYSQEEAMRLRLGAVFVSGLAFLVLTLLKLRTWLAAAISPSLKHSFAVGIGLFLLLLGMVNTGIVQLGPKEAPLQIGPLHERVPVQLALAGFVGMGILLLWRVKGAILLGIIGTAVAGYFCGLVKGPEKVLALPWQEEYHLGSLAGQLDIVGVLQFDFLPILLTLFLMSFLDTLGTLVALGSAGGMLDEKGNLPDMEKPMLVDALACMFSAVVGTSTSGAYIESATGIREGARTGLAAVITGLCFALALFFLPFITSLQALNFAYGPALMMVGVLMMAAVKHIEVDDLTELIPAVATVVMMVFTFNIANGMTAGLLLHPFLKLAAGRWREIHPGSVVLGGLGLVYYTMGFVH